MKTNILNLIPELLQTGIARLFVLITDFLDNWNSNLNYSASQKSENDCSSYMNSINHFSVGSEVSFNFKNQSANRNFQKKTHQHHYSDFRPSNRKKNKKQSPQNGNILTSIFYNDEQSSQQSISTPHRLSHFSQRNLTPSNRYLNPTKTYLQSKKCLQTPQTHFNSECLRVLFTPFEVFCLNLFSHQFSQFKKAFLSLSEAFLHNLMEHSDFGSQSGEQSRSQLVYDYLKLVSQKANQPDYSLNLNFGVCLSLPSFREVLGCIVENGFLLNFEPVKLIGQILDILIN